MMMPKKQLKHSMTWWQTIETSCLGCRRMVRGSEQNEESNVVHCCTQDNFNMLVQCYGVLISLG
jgi:hypothetical protein